MVSALTDGAGERDEEDPPRQPPWAPGLHLDFLNVIPGSQALLMYLKS